MKTLDLTKYVKDGMLPVRCADIAVRFMVARERRDCEDIQKMWMDIAGRWRQEAISRGYRDIDGNECVMITSSGVWQERVAK